MKIYIRLLGRCERIRTFDPLHPMQVRYQAAPHTDQPDYSLRLCRHSVRRAEQVAYFKQLSTDELQALLGDMPIREVRSTA